MTGVAVYYPVLGYVRAELIINCIVVAFVLIVVGLRVAGRLMGPGLGMDDYLIMLSVVCCTWDCASAWLLTVCSR